MRSGLAGEGPTVTTGSCLPVEALQSRLVRFGKRALTQSLLEGSQFCRGRLDSPQEGLELLARIFLPFWGRHGFRDFHHAVGQRDLFGWSNELIADFRVGIEER